MATPVKKTSNGAPSPAPAKRHRTPPATVDGTSVNLSELGLVSKFVDTKSQYERELDALIAETNASDNPTAVGRKYTDVRAIKSLKTRADLKKIRLQFLMLPNNTGFVVRIDPDPKPIKHRKKADAPQSQPTGQPNGSLPEQVEAA